MADLKSYRVVDDAVQFVAGKRVPEDRIIRMTEEAARYDVEAGVIAPVAISTDASKSRALKASVEG